jgi:SAM-dependent methyltransferase
VVIPAKEISDYLTKGGHPDGADPGCVPDMPMVLAVNLVNSALVAFELASYLEQTRWWFFFGLVVTLTGVRAAGWRCYYHNQKTEGAPGKWALFATAGSGLSGLLWGLGSTLLLPDIIVEQTFFAFVIGGMCAGEALPLPDGAVDVALSSTVFEEGDAELMLSEIVRVTRPGGRVGIAVRAIDMPFWVNLPLEPALKAKVDAPGIIGGGAAPKGVADMSLYRRLAALGLTGLKCFPQLVSVVPGSERIERYQRQILAALTAAEVER